MFEGLKGLAIRFGVHAGNLDERLKALEDSAKDALETRIKKFEEDFNFEEKFQSIKAETSPPMEGQSKRAFRIKLSLDIGDAAWDSGIHNTARTVLQEQIKMFFPRTICPDISIKIPHTNAHEAALKRLRGNFKRPPRPTPTPDEN